MAEIDLAFLAKQNERILAELADARGDRAEMRAEQHALAALLGKVSDAVIELQIAQSALSTDLKATKEVAEDVSERLQTVEGRLNTIDSRLARIECHTGLVKA